MFTKKSGLDEKGLLSFTAVVNYRVSPVTSSRFFSVIALNAANKIVFGRGELEVAIIGYKVIV